MTYPQAASFLMTSGGLVVDARNFNAFQLCSLAGSAARFAHLLIIKHAERLTSSAQLAIGRNGRSCVVFDFGG